MVVLNEKSLINRSYSVLFFLTFYQDLWPLPDCWLLQVVKMLFFYQYSSWQCGDSPRAAVLDQHPQGVDGVQVPTEGELLHWEGLVFLFQVFGEVWRKLVN